MNASGRASLLSDDELIDRVKAGESELFGQLLDPHARKMHVLAYSILRNDHDAEDAVQDSALRAFTRLAQLRSNSSFKWWLFRLTTNEARMRRRRTRSEEQKRCDDRSGVVLQCGDSRDNPENVLQRKELEGAVHHAYNELPSKYKNILRLYCNENLSAAEIGGVLGLGMPAVRTQLHRARRRLRKRLGSAVAAD